jgi:pimeloyl-ACP methyl ester carboxylesterase
MNAAFDTSFGPELLLEARTIEQQAAQIREREGTHRVLVKFHTGGAKCPLFLAHPAGGSVFGYDGIARALPDRPVYGLQDPHIFETRGVFESIEEMAQAYLPHIRRAHPDGPYMIGGWSLGGVLAFEIANRLVADGARVANLILFDAASPPSAGERLRLWRRFVPQRALLLALSRSAPLRALFLPLLRRRAARHGNDEVACAREMARFDIDESPGALEVFFPWLSRAERAQGLDHVLREAVRRVEAKDNIVPGVSPRNHLHRRRIHQRNLHTLFRRYRPLWRYEGLTTMFRQPEEHVAPWRARGWAGRYDWARYCVGRLDTHFVELLATPEQPDPHENTLLPINTERYMAVVKEAIDRSEPG